MVKVKICGVTNLEDALLACKLGAAALGFIFYRKSPRYVQPEGARAIIQAVPPFVTTVGVFVNEPLAEVKQVIQVLSLNVVQLHGDETPEYCSQISHPYLKVFRVKDDFDVETLTNYQASGFLLDTYDDSNYGGTGVAFDWQIARKAREYGRIVLSGGLSPSNVLQAITFVQPYAVDVGSGVEAYPGKKDHQKLKSFFSEIEKVSNGT